VIDLKLLEQKGINPDKLRAKLQPSGFNWVPKKGAWEKDPGYMTHPTNEPGESDAERVHKLILRIRSRIQEGMTRNFQDFRVYYALDVAWDTPFRQITPTLISTFLDADPNDEKVYKAVQDWGLAHLIQNEKDPKTGKDVKTLNLPVFFSVVVPLVRAYVTIRWAKVMNDRRQFPYYKYEPAKNTTELSLKCEALSDRVQVMSSQYGYYDQDKQAVLKMLHYGLCLKFIKEAWHSEEQWKEADAQDVQAGAEKPDGNKASIGDPIKVTTREGLRYHIPHPSRIFRDLAHGPWTFNYDCGCEYGGYWRIARYREIEQNPDFWNRDKIGFGAVDFVSGNRLFFTTVYSACTLTIPVAQPDKQPEGPALGAGIGLGAGDLDREKEIATIYYGTEHGDQGVLVTEYFEKLIPSQNGLGDYDCPVWFRFVVAGDSCTILYAEPLPYVPITYYGYDADESRSKPASLSLEVLPFQDHFSNLLTQTILTCKQNLANLTFIDSDQIDVETQGKIKGIGASLYRFLNIMPYSSKKAARLQNKLAEAVQSYALPKGNVAELIGVMKQILDVIERVLVMSSQEVGQAASHELRAEEVRNIQASTSTRLIFTATPVDIATDADKRRIYQALMAYGDEEFSVHVPAESPVTPDQFKAMGFTFGPKQVQTQFPGAARDRYIHARVKKSALAMDLWSFASTKNDADRVGDAQMAVAMSQITLNLLNNPMTAQAIGPDQAIDLANHIWRLSGLPRDMKLRNVSPAPDPQQAQQEAQQQLAATAQAVLKAIQPELHPLMDEVKRQRDEINVVFRALNLPIPQPSNDNTPPTAAPGPGPGIHAPMAQPAGVPALPGAPGQPGGG